LDKTDKLEQIKQEEICVEPEETIPDEERRKIIKKLATGAFVVPLVLLLLEGGKSISYGY
jgi:hypothetical protein